MTFCFDLDGTLCQHRHDGAYQDALPFRDRIDRVRELYEQGHTIVINTARGSVTGVPWTARTIEQLADWGVPYHRLIVGEKPYADLYVDDKAANATEFF